MVHHDRPTDWDAHPRRSGPVIVDDRILTSCAVVRARMDGWWTVAVGNGNSRRSLPETGGRSIDEELPRHENPFSWINHSGLTPAEGRLTRTLSRQIVARIGLQSL